MLGWTACIGMLSVFSVPQGRVVSLWRGGTSHTSCPPTGGGGLSPTPKMTDRERQSRSGPRMPVPWWNVEVSIYDQGAGGRTSQEREGDSP